MARRAIAVEIVFNNFAEIAAKLPEATSEIVEQTMFDVERRAKLKVPVDTGALRASIQSEMVEQTVGVVYTNMEYAPFVEYGTTRMAGQPYMTPAGEQARQGFIDAMSDLEDKLQ